MTDTSADTEPSEDVETPRLAERLAGGPVGAATVLVLGGGLLVWQVLTAFDGVAALVGSPLGVAALLSALSLVGIAGFAQFRSGFASESGIASILAAVAAVTLLLVAPAELSNPNRVFLGLLVSSVGGALCIGWQPGKTTVSLRGRPSVLRAARLAVVVCVSGLVVVNAGPAAVVAMTPQQSMTQSAGDTFPRSLNQSGGFVVATGTLDAGYYDYDPDCGTLGATCPTITVDSSKHDSVQVARLRLDNRHGNDLVANDFLIYKDFYLTEELKDRYIENETLKDAVDAIHFEMSADRAIATGASDGRALDVYVSEVHIETMEARFDLIGWIDWDPRLDTIENYWSCEPWNASGWGSINDDRLGVSADPRVTDGQNIQQLTHQLGSTETVLYDFELNIGLGPRGDINTGMEAPAGCS